MMKTNHEAIFRGWAGVVVAWCFGAANLPATALYDFGNPSPDEQHYLELINRARAAPPAEGARLAATSDPDVLNAIGYYDVNLTMMQQEFNAIAAQPPLAPNAKLTGTARGHSAWMLANATQSHNETNPSNTPFTRMNAAGYNYTYAAENIYAYAKSVWFGHAGFQIDWGDGGSGGMQDGRGHRAKIHSGNYREIGVGLAYGTNGGMGPQWVTQDFGTAANSPSFATGVAYYDLDSNDFYDPGEGIAGLTVGVTGGGYHCHTAAGGGWALPIPLDAATRTVTFSGLNTNRTLSLVVPAGKNAKADLKLTYAPPAITSGATAYAGFPHTITFQAAEGATAYRWDRWTSVAAAAENCDNTQQITASTTGNYSLLNTTVKQQGSAAFHLQNTTGNSQSIELNSLYYGSGTPVLTFQSRIRYATSAERFKVQVKEEGSLAWQDVFSQTGTNAAGETSFHLRSVNITGKSNKSFRVRFLLSYSPGGGYYDTSGDTVGWFIDAINFSGISALSNNTSQVLAATSGSFTPAAGSYIMAVAPVISSRRFPASYQTLVVSTIPVTAPAITSQPSPVVIPSGNTATFHVTASGTSPSFQWYAGESGNTGNPVPGAIAATFTTPVLTDSHAYWVRASNPAGTADSITATATVTDSFASWAAQLEATRGLAPGTLANAPLADYDRDGRANLLEYAFGLSPLLAGDTNARLPALQLTPTHLVLRYVRDTSRTDLTFTPQTFTADGSWLAPGDAQAPAGFTDTLVGSTGNLETRETQLPRAAASALLRIQVARP